MATGENIDQRLKRIKPVLQEKYHVSKIGYFGSYAREKQTEESDIDILVEFSKPIGLEFVSVKEYLEQELNRKVDLVTERALKPQLKESILREVIYK
ncbi:nucleotidyltransferase family protein [Salibacterium aidingense]|uniref:nucleotidyltransferase family protein n=1 Tax=Salibacterium aidingense TaxID=384933 RepID=UPI00041B2E8F|nr:nucleotidyltransferase family protein [Salibacterium aidingense]